MFQPVSAKPERALQLHRQKSKSLRLQDRQANEEENNVPELNGDSGVSASMRVDVLHLPEMPLQAFPVSNPERDYEHTPHTETIPREKLQSIELRSPRRPQSRLKSLRQVLKDNASTHSPQTWPMIDKGRSSISQPVFNEENHRIRSREVEINVRRHPDIVPSDDCDNVQQQKRYRHQGVSSAENPSQDPRQLNETAENGDQIGRKRKERLFDTVDMSGVVNNGDEMSISPSRSKNPLIPRIYNPSSCGPDVPYPGIHGERAEAFENTHEISKQSDKRQKTDTQKAKRHPVKSAKHSRKKDETPPARLKVRKKKRSLSEQIVPGLELLRYDGPFSEPSKKSRYEGHWLDQSKSMSKHKELSSLPDSQLQNSRDSERTLTENVSAPAKLLIDSKMEHGDALYIPELSRPITPPDHPKSKRHKREKQKKKDTIPISTSPVRMAGESVQCTDEIELQKITEGQGRRTSSRKHCSPKQWWKGDS